MSAGEYRVEEKKGGMPGWLKGCLIALVVVLVLMALVAWWVSRNWQGWFASFGSQVAEQMIDDSQLPEAEKAEVKAQVQRIVTLAKENKLTNEQFTRLLEGFGESPLISTFVIFAVEKQYFDKSGLTDEEKEAGRIALRRVVHGVVNEDIKQAQVETLMDSIMVDKGDGKKELKQQLTDEELKAFLADATKLADDAGVPAEVPEVDPSDELKRIIDEAIAEPANE